MSRLQQSSSAPQPTPPTHASQTLRKRWMKSAIWLRIIRSMRFMIQISPEWNMILIDFAPITKNLARQKFFVGHWKKNLMRKNRILNRITLILKITKTDKNCQISTYRTRTIALTPKKVVVTAHTLQTAIVAAITVTLELFALKQELTRLTLCLIHCSHAIF